jgi:hypothetical protein
LLPIEPSLRAPSRCTVVRERRGFQADGTGATAAAFSGCGVVCARIRTAREVPTMYYKPKSVAALHIALAGLPDRMRVEADPGVGVSAKTVGELRKVTTWSENLVITTPQDRYPESAVKVSKASGPTRTSPKP